MPDATLILEGTAAAGGVAALVMLLLGVWPAQDRSHSRHHAARGSRLSPKCWPSPAEWGSAAGGLVSNPTHRRSKTRTGCCSCSCRQPESSRFSPLSGSARRWVGRILRVLLALSLPFLMLFGSGWLPAKWTPGGDPAAPSTWTEQERYATLWVWEFCWRPSGAFWFGWLSGREDLLCRRPWG